LLLDLSVGAVSDEMSIFTLEQELQELVERMLDDTDLASYADVISRAKEEIERLRADKAALATQVDLTIANLSRNEAEVERLRAEIERLRTALQEAYDAYDHGASEICRRALEKTA
jgi:hypothetical protein